VGQSRGSSRGLGDAITNQASAHAKKQHEHDGQEDATANATEGTVVIFSPTPADATEDTTEANTAENQPMPKWASNFAASVLDKQNQQAILGSFRNWRTNIVESTKKIVDETQKMLEKEHARIQVGPTSVTQFFHWMWRLYGTRRLFILPIELLH